MAELRQLYWHPAYAYVRRKGASVDAAQELTPGFYEQVFELLAPWLSRERQGVWAADVARQLGTTEGTVSVVVHRLRRRYREVLHGVVLWPVDSPTEVPEELRYRLRALQTP